MNRDLRHENEPHGKGHPTPVTDTESKKRDVWVVILARGVVTPALSASLGVYSLCRPHSCDPGEPNQANRRK